MRSAGLGSGIDFRQAWNIRNRSRRSTPFVPWMTIWCWSGRTPQESCTCPIPLLAGDQRPPVVERQVRIAAARLPGRVHLLDRAQERLDDVEAWMPRSRNGYPAVRYWGGTPAPATGGYSEPRRMSTATTSPSLPARTDSRADCTWGSQSSECADADLLALRPRQIAQPHALVRVGRERLLHEHVAPGLQRLGRHRRVGVRRRDDVDDVGARGAQRGQRLRRPAR